MKKKFIIYSTVVGLVFSSCNKDFDTINNNTKAAENVPASTLFSNAQRELVDNMTTPSVNINIFRLLAQQWAETTYADETQYNLSTRNIPRNFWNDIYRDVLKDFSESTRLINADNSFTDEAVRKNQLAMSEFMSIYAWSVMVLTYGDIPYSEALDYNNPTPKYDDAATIYSDLLTRLDAAIASVDASKASFDDGSADIIYGGDMTKWLKFANSLKLRLGMILADSDAAKSKSVVEAAVTAGVFTSNADNALFNYLSAPPNTNPVWVNLIQSQRVDFVASNTIVDIMNPLNDPRLPSYFNDISGQYLGGTFGSVNNNTSFSLPGDKITATTFPGDLLDYAEVEFYLAEAVERGYSVGSGTAEDHYNNAVTASIKAWGGSDQDASDYLAQTDVAYTTATGNYKEKIGTQKWIAMYNRGFEAWTEYRRLDFPVLNVVSPADAQGDFPNRYSYSDQEISLNKDNWSAAAAKYDGDKVSVKLFWDKF